MERSQLKQKIKIQDLTLKWTRLFHSKNLNRLFELCHRNSAKKVIY